MRSTICTDGKVATCKLQVTQECDAMNQVLEAIQTAVREAADHVGPAVVGLRRGSGVVIAPGRVLTVAHVLRGDEATVTFADGRSATGRVISLDADLDVGVIEVDTSDIAPVEWAKAGSAPA